MHAYPISGKDLVIICPNNTLSENIIRLENWVCINTLIYYRLECSNIARSINQHA